MKFVIAEDGCYYNPDKIMSLSRTKFGNVENNECHKVLYAAFVGMRNETVRLFTSTDVPHGVDTYLREHDLEMVK